MGVDLMLLPVDGWYTGNCFSHTTLSCDPDGDLWDRIHALETSHVPVGDQFDSYAGGRIPDGTMAGGPCYGHTVETPYGYPVLFVNSEVLAGAMLAGELTRKNRAIAEYLKAIESTPVALYWH